MKKVCAPFFLVFLVLLLFGSEAEAKVVASSFSDRYHQLTCKIAKKIRPQDKVFFDSGKEAADAGFNACMKCHPKVFTNNFSADRSRSE